METTLRGDAEIRSYVSRLSTICNTLMNSSIVSRGDTDQTSIVAFNDLLAGARSITRTEKIVSELVHLISYRDVNSCYEYLRNIRMTHLLLCGDVSGLELLFGDHIKFNEQGKITEVSKAKTVRRERRPSRRRPFNSPTRFNHPRGRRFYPRPDRSSINGESYMENMKGTFDSLEELECGNYVEKGKRKPSSYLDKVVKRSASAQEKTSRLELTGDDHAGVDQVARELAIEKEKRTMMDEAFDQLIEKTKDLTGKSWADIFDDESGNDKSEASDNDDLPGVDKDNAEKKAHADGELKIE